MVDNVSISKLAPKEMDRTTPGLKIMVNELAMHALTSHHDFLVELYLAGVWHGVECVRQNLGATPEDIVRNANNGQD
jgi:hypothetical protein